MNKICIYKEKDLNKLRSLSKNKSYLIEIENDLDMQGINFEPINMENITFILNGNNHVIRNLCIDRKFDKNVGLFSIVSSGVVKNIIFNNAFIYGKQKVGIISGVFDGCITNVKACGKIEGDYIIGSLIGESYVKSSLYNCYFKGTVDGNTYIGGILGKGNIIEMADTYSEGYIYFRNIHARETTNEYVGDSNKLFLSESIINKKPYILSKGTYGLVFS